MAFLNRIFFLYCVLGLKKCSSEKPCPVHFTVQPFKKKFLKEMEENSIASFAEKVEKGEAYLFIETSPS